MKKKADQGIDGILGLSDVEIVRVERRRDIRVWARPTKRPVCLYCGHGGLRIKATYERELKHTRQGNQILIVHLAVPKYHCAGCGRYFRHRFSGIRPRYRATETYRLEVFDGHHGGISQSQLTSTHAIGSATIERWYHHFIEQRVSELSGRTCPQVLGIDEHFFSRKRGYATTFVDLKNHKVYDVVPGRSEDSLRSYLRRLPGRDKVKVIVMDLSETYRAIARKYFPNAKIVADRFHVIRLLNQHFLEGWKRFDPEGRKNRGLLSLMRRHRWKLSEEQRKRLAVYLKANPVLEALYTAKQDMALLLTQKSLNAKKASQLIPDLLRLIDQFAASPLKSLADTLTSWLEPVARMWRFSRNNGITEGFHTKMEMISRRAFGFRNFHNYRLRVLALCGWNGVINRV
ncbi:ISL3 family transposase [Sphingopyxis sp. 113P3]|uniref:ISL3 family transposase n=1 Tax=Sphingopyxis sp. (strain 113P3) TaxID=292913 RepID=UPI0006BC9537|nr:ISL3 family transposase [Sphingopyxis sp. 113P3]ALC10931.1 transposase [Sphingopyxis sp. 113P3]